MVNGCPKAVELAFSVAPYSLTTGPVIKFSVGSVPGVPIVLGGVPDSMV
jgi:hypothetical protein